MADLSVGQASAIIAAVVFALQTLLPLLVPLLLIAFFRETRSGITASAGSWSAVDRALQSTLWPTILRSDSSIGPGLPKRINAILWVGILLVPLIAVAAIVTPLGLFEAIVPAASQTSPEFRYIQDTSVFGQSATGRNADGFYRQCVFFSGGQCDAVTGTTPINVTTGQSIVPTFLVDRFQSGLKHQMKSVAGIFQIQWRTFGLTETVFANETVNMGKFRQYSSVALDDEVAVYEGLIVDTKNGGIGFRNHSVPAFSEYGSSWKEDILFTDPVTECVDTNLTLRYTNGPNGIPESFPYKLLDRGGLSDLDDSYDWWTPQIDQGKFDLRARAYRGAWLNNYITRSNLTGPINSTSPSGDIYNLPRTSTINIQPYKLSMEQYLAYFGPPSTGLTVNQTVFTTNTIYPARTNLTWPFNYTMPEIGCIGQGEMMVSNISTVFVKCGLLYSPPRLIDDPNRVVDVDRPDEAYEQTIYSCATAVRASLKTVTFTYNTTTSFEGLNVRDVRPKDYSGADMPTWGVEASGLTLRSLAPLWGLIDPAETQAPNLTTIQKEHLWLPGKLPSLSQVVPAVDNFPALNFYRTVAGTVYNIGSSRNSPSDSFVDYTGDQDFRMHQKWFELAANASSAGTILNLIWTDLAANAVVGTRGWHTEDVVRGFTKRDEITPRADEQVSVTTYARALQYRWWPYFIPGAIVLISAGLLILAVFILMLTRATGIKKLNRFLDHTSLGRNLTAWLYPESSSLNSKRKLWLESDGKKPITLFGEAPSAPEATPVLHVEKNATVTSDRRLLGDQHGNDSDIELRQI